MAREPRSEQQESLELEAEARPAETGLPAGHQVARPDGGEPTDREPTEIAEDAGTESSVGPEQQAMRIERGEDRSGRVGGPGRYD
jgi:hypothetical protein